MRRFEWPASSVLTIRATAGALAFAAVTLLLASTARADVKIHGATTVAFGLMKPNEAKLEQLTGIEITILPSSTLHGLTDLVQGRADIAMLSEPLEIAAGSLNAKQPGLVNQTDFVDKHVGDAWVQFIVHPSNPIRTLTKTQLAALYSGKTKNWSELGGHNQPVLLVGQPTSAAYRMIEEALGITFAPDVRIVQNTNQTAIIVAQAPGAISNVSSLHDVPERSRLKVVDAELKLALHLYLAFRKDAPELVKKVVDAAAAIGSQ